MSAALDRLLEPVLTQIGKLWQRVDLAPAVRWGTVTQVSPLRVMLDGDAAVLPFSPQSAVQGLVTGSRVVCIEQNRRVIVLSSSSEAIGLVSAFAGAAAPGGWLLCDGAAVSRTTYSALFAVIGTAYGAGNGSSTFNLPDLRGRVPAGRDTSQTEFDVLGEKGGAKTHTLTVAEMPSHQHNMTFVSGTGSSGYIPLGATGAQYTSPTELAGGGGAHNNLQPYLVLNHIIKAL